MIVLCLFYFIPPQGWEQWAGSCSNTQDEAAGQDPVNEVVVGDS